MIMSVTTTILLASGIKYGSKQGALELEYSLNFATKQKRLIIYAVRQVKRRQVYFANEKLGSSLCSANFIKF